ncbi:MAG: hypothetical protein ACREUE_01995 [Panacagrimonas sp.]
MSPKKKSDKSTSGVAQALLDAQVAFVVDELVHTRKLTSVIDQLLDAVLDDAAELKLEQMVTRDMIKATARTYAIELDLQGGIPELVGDVARALHAHPIHERTRLGDLLSPRRFEDLLDHVLALKSLRRRIIDELLGSPLYESIASDLLYNGIRDYLARTEVPSGIPGARSALRLGRAVVKRATAGFEDVLEESIKRHIGRSVGRVSRETAQPLLEGDHDGALREVALDSWQRLRELTLGELRRDLSALDVEELFVTLYECWKEMRRTPVIGAMIDTGIDTFFDKYGDQSLAALLEDLGVDRALMRSEALRFGPHVIGELHAAGRLEPAVRRLLEPFYRSGAVEKVLAKAR